MRHIVDFDKEVLRTGEPANAAAGESGDPGLALLCYTNPSILVPPAELERLAGITAAGVQLLGLIGAGDNGLDLIIPTKGEVRLLSAPPLCLGMIATSSTGFEHLRRQTRALRKLGSFRDLPARLLPEFEAGADWALTASLVHLLKKQSGQITALTSELTRLRMMYEQIMNDFAELENKTAAVGLTPIRLVFENPPGRLRAAGGPGVASLSQILPASSAGMSAIEIHLEGAAEAERISASLVTLEDGFNHCRWDLQRDDLKQGWLVLQLSKGVGGQPRTAVLELRTENKAKGLPKVSLGSPLAHEAYRARSPDMASAPRGGLAMRVWKGVPGLRPPVLTTLEPPRQDKPGPRVHDVAIPFHVLRRVVLLPGQWRPDFEIMEMRPESNGFLLHPGPGGEITLASLDALSMSEPSLLSTEVNVESPHANPIEFALAVSAAEGDDVRKIIATCDGPVDFLNFSFSGWRRVSFGESALLSLVLRGPVGRVFFATRMSDAKPEWFAWATFGRFRQTFLGHEAENKALPSDANILARTGRISCRLHDHEPAAVRFGPMVLLGEIECEATVCQPDGASAPQVEFGLALTTLGPLGVAARAVAGRAAIEDESFAFSGWITPPCDKCQRIGVRWKQMAVREGVLVLLARLRGVAGQRPVAVSFDDITIRAANG